MICGGAAAIEGWATIGVPPGVMMKFPPVVWTYGRRLSEENATFTWFASNAIFLAGGSLGLLLSSSPSSDTVLEESDRG